MAWNFIAQTPGIQGRKMGGESNDPGAVAPGWIRECGTTISFRDTSLSYNDWYSKSGLEWRWHSAEATLSPSVSTFNFPLDNSPSLMPTGTG